MAKPLSPRPIPQILRETLTGLGHFVYIPNPGNMGDALIAVASMQVFEQLNLSYEIYDANKSYPDGYCLVYGGGGAMVPNWGVLSQLQQIFSAPNIGRCIILPHSMRDCDDLLKVFDERFTVFCREKQSYHYCKSINNTASFILSDDMACYLDVSKVPTIEEAQRKLPRPGILTQALSISLLPRHCKTAIVCRAYRKSVDRLNRHLAQRTQQLPNGNKMLIAMRNDSEAAESILPQSLQELPNVDISRYGGGDCKWKDFTLLLVSQFLNALSRIDILITDRLHATIAATLLGRNVVMIDNNYGKLSGVWEQSLQQFSNCHLCRSKSDIENTLQNI